MTREPKKPLEEIVSEVGRYPMGAFIFVQECIGVASEKVHGPMTPAQASVARWMAERGVDLEQLENLYEVGRLPPEIAHALEAVGGIDQMNRHVTGQQLCWAIREAAMERWGPMAPVVLDRWRIRRTEDIGAIIFALVDHDWLQKQPTDSIEDFHNVYSFDEAFKPKRRVSDK